jgi:hypothetical protein
MRYLDADSRGPLPLLALAPTAVPANPPWAFPEKLFDYSMSYAERGRDSRVELWPLVSQSRRELNLASDPSIIVARGRLALRHGYEAWTGFYAGYGQFFPDDKLGRSRTSGVGIEDADWLFVKVSFSF